MDAWKFKIPNKIVIAILVLFFPTVLSLPLELDIGSHLATAFLVLVGGVALFLLGFIGAGDAKLLAAISLWAWHSDCRGRAYSGDRAAASRRLPSLVTGAILTLVLFAERRAACRKQVCSPIATSVCIASSGSAEAT
ncbi:MAG: prepilin peptidase [Sphingomonadales bacterium]